MPQDVPHQRPPARHRLIVLAIALAVAAGEVVSLVSFADTQRPQPAAASQTPVECQWCLEL